MAPGQVLGLSDQAGMTCDLFDEFACAEERTLEGVDVIDRHALLA